MDNLIESEDISIPLEQNYWLLIAENLFVLAILVGVIMLYIYTKRSGTLMMLIGVTTYLILSIAIFPLLIKEFALSGFLSHFILFWPNLIIASLMVSCIGFLRFSWSFKDES